ncbi:MAG TPA: DNA-3-methyladenine glycosylase [Patescibacteria group bacterium]
MTKSTMALSRKFYQKNTLKVAQELLGCFLVRKIGRKIIRGRITETEAYIGEDDLACHASKGRTPRTEIMYGQAGHAYVYMIYGMYNCLNVVTEKKDFPAAVLIRGIEIENKPPRLGKERVGLPASARLWQAGERLDGPGKLCRFLKIDRKLNGWDLTKGDRLWIEKPAQEISKKSIVAGRRIGVDYARHCKHYLWRFSFDKKGKIRA